MAGGLDILIVGIAGENLDYISSDERLKDLFNKRNDDEKSAEEYVKDFHSLASDPSVANPRIFYLAGEHICGSQVGVGLGYIIFDGNNNSYPRKLNERMYERIAELKQRFINEVEAKGLEVPHDQVGVYALNVYDT